MTQSKTDELLSKEESGLDLEALLHSFGTPAIEDQEGSSQTTHVPVAPPSEGPIDEYPGIFTVSIRDIDVDNPGGGDCAFYAFAIGLIHIILYESYTNSRATFDKWIQMDPSIAELYDDLLLFKPSVDFKKQSGSAVILGKLQHSLREVVFKLYINSLKKDCADVSSCRYRFIIENPPTADELQKAQNGSEILIIQNSGSYTIGFRGDSGEYLQRNLENAELIDLCKTYRDRQTINNAADCDKFDKVLKQLGASIESKDKYAKLIANSLFIEFSCLFGEFNANDHVRFDDRKNLPEIRYAIDHLNRQFKALFSAKKYSFAEQNRIEQAATIRLFLQLLYGKQQNYDNITESTAPAQKSPIVRALETIKKDSVWGCHLDVDTLANYFQLNFHYLVDGEAGQPFKDDPQNHVITLNNHHNVHWTTKVTISKNKNREREAICEQVDALLIRLREEFTREMLAHPLLAENEILAAEMHFLQESFVDHANFVHYASKFSEVDEHTKTMYACICGLQKHAEKFKRDLQDNPELTMLPNRKEVVALLSLLQSFSGALADPRNGTTLSRARYHITRMLKNLIEMVANYLDITLDLDKHYHGPIRRGFWSQSKIVGRLLQPPENPVEPKEDKAQTPIPLP